MTDERRVQELLLELLASQRTPEEVCATCPELLPEVRERWRQMGQVRAELDALFPPPSEPGTPPPTISAGDAKSTVSFSPPWESGTSPPTQSPEDTDLPRIPGYEVEAVLGRGGMGVVYKARHLRLNRPVALKMLVAGKHGGRVSGFGTNYCFLHSIIGVAGHQRDRSGGGGTWRYTPSYPSSSSSGGRAKRTSRRLVPVVS